MEDADKLPRFSYDLVSFLDENIARPSFPATAEAFAGLDAAALRRAAFTAGARSLVDQLIAWRDELEEEVDGEADDAGVPDGPGPVFPPLYGPSGEVRTVSSSFDVAVDATAPLLGGGDPEE